MFVGVHPGQTCSTSALKFAWFARTSLTKGRQRQYKRGRPFHGSFIYCESAHYHTPHCQGAGNGSCQIDYEHNGWVACFLIFYGTISLPTDLLVARGTPHFLKYRKIFMQSINVPVAGLGASCDGFSCPNVLYIWSAALLVRDLPCTIKEKRLLLEQQLA